MSTRKYWCPTCGEQTATDFFGIADMMAHRAGCRAKFIPVVEPLDVPEVTTWDCPEVVTVCDDVKGHTTLCSPDAVLLDDGYAWADHLSQIWFTDVDSVNYVAGVRK
jgi:hypothetical protein